MQHLWKPGQSGNPKGRPPNSRMLAELLREAGQTKIKRGGHFVPRNVLVAENCWQLLTEGQCALLNGATFKISGKDYLELIRFVFGHVDGPVRPDVNISLEQTKIYVGVSPDDWDDTVTIEALPVDVPQIEAPKRKRSTRKTTRRTAGDSAMATQRGEPTGRHKASTTRAKRLTKIVQE